MCITVFQHCLVQRVPVLYCVCGRLCPICIPCLIPVTPNCSHQASLQCSAFFSLPSLLLPCIVVPALLFPLYPVGWGSVYCPNQEAVPSPVAVPVLPVHAVLPLLWDYIALPCPQLCGATTCPHGGGGGTRIRFLAIAACVCLVICGCLAFLPPHTTVPIPFHEPSVPCIPSSSSVCLLHLVPPPCPGEGDPLASSPITLPAVPGCIGGSQDGVP